MIRSPSDWVGSPRLPLVLMMVLAALVAAACGEDSTGIDPSRTVPHETPWGIYALDLATQDVTLVYGTTNEIQTSALRLNADGTRLVFAQKVDGSQDTNLEIYSVGVDGQGLSRLTHNSFMDVYPVWSPDESHIGFLSRREQDLDLYVMDADGSSDHRLFDSGDNDGDIDWKGSTIAFTSGFAIWTMKDDGTEPVQITEPPNRGQWGQANLPAGDYDPRLSPDGNTVVFERLLDTSPANGAYDFFLVNTDGTGERRLTTTGYAQGLASWSHAADRLVYVVAAIGGQGKYDLYSMDTDGSNIQSITPDYFPADFLCHSPIFSRDDARIFFIGQWWQ